MLSPQQCLEKLDDAGVNQYQIAKKTGVNQSSVSRYRSNSFKRQSWQVVERIQSLYQHVCVDKEPVNEFIDYADFINQAEKTEPL